MNFHYHKKRRIVKKRINRFIKYIRKPSNEFGFFVLSIHEKFSNLPVNIKIDDDGSWTNLCGKKIILFQTNKNDDTDYNKLLPMSIENEPKILVKNQKIDLEQSEIDQIKYFVKECQKELLQISAGKICTLDFFDILKARGFYQEKKY